MKRVLLILLCLAVTSPMFSQSAPRYEAPTPLPQLNVTFSDLLGHANERHSRITPLVAWGDTEPIFIFPLVGSTPGSGGTFFHTETVIANPTNHPQDILVFWLPIGGGASNCTRPGVSYHMDTNTWYYWTDLAAQLLGVSGLGAVVVAAVDSSGNADANAHLDGFSRIWTLIPGSTGSVAQSFVAESVNFNASVQGAYGLRQDSAFRTNIGIFNYASVSRSFRVQIVGTIASSDTTTTVDACTVSLFSAPAGTYGRVLLYLSATDGGGLWYGFGSSLDNVSGASWSSVAHPY